MRIGIDLGGTKIEGLALDRTGQAVLRRRISTPRDDYPGTIQAIVHLVHELEATLGEAATIGVAMPGAISPATGRIKNANSVWLNHQPFHHDLTQALGRPVRFRNDADCFALSEATDGAAAGASIVFGVIVGTGTGGGIVIHGQLLSGPNAIAGEWGHNPLPWPTEAEWPGPSCYCGQRGCIETFLSGTGFARDYRQATGQELRGSEIVALAEAGDFQAELALVRYESRMARALASVINILDPEIIVLGGGMSNISRFYTQIPQLWGAYVFSDRVDTRLVQAKYGDSSGVRGAAWLWPDSSS
ncbi:ROK family protein [Anthocerotibacter panamensis]|uniref:ROK family protein n=1 Tax=Anthocerotibacter panamensis TaxID=2857077 RepID=UPI001C402C05|nr:ROK family protein [Anthocerotibacter panamensis]